MPGIGSVALGGRTDGGQKPFVPHALKKAPGPVVAEVRQAPKLLVGGVVGALLVVRDGGLLIGPCRGRGQGRGQHGRRRQVWKCPFRAHGSINDCLVQPVSPESMIGMAIQHLASPRSERIGSMPLGLHQLVTQRSWSYSA